MAAAAGTEARVSGWRDWHWLYRGHGVVCESVAVVWANSKSDPFRPNVILLGIDSLRLEELARFGGTKGNTSHIDSFLRDADIFPDASTPWREPTVPGS